MGSIYGEGIGPALSDLRDVSDVDWWKKVSAACRWCKICVCMC